jgi:hypothetical protein
VAERGLLAAAGLALEAKPPVLTTARAAALLPRLEASADAGGRIRESVSLTGCAGL